MVKRNKKRSKSSVSNKILWTIIVILLVMAGSLIASLIIKDNVKSATDTNKGVHISLGSLTWHVVNGKMEVYDTASTKALRNLLTSEAKKDIQLGCTSSWYSVGVFNSDRTQVLLKYGCEYPGASMFAVTINGTWKLISPTNQFDEFDIPICDYVNQNNIDKSIAPICTSNIQSPQYTIR
jgi:hypothetical protein